MAVWTVSLNITLKAPLAMQKKRTMHWNSTWLIAENMLFTRKNTCVGFALPDLKGVLIRLKPQWREWPSPKVLSTITCPRTSQELFNLKQTVGGRAESYANCERGPVGLSHTNPTRSKPVRRTLPKTVGEQLDNTAVGRPSFPSLWIPKQSLYTHGNVNTTLSNAQNTLQANSVKARALRLFAVARSTVNPGLTQDQVCFCYSVHYKGDQPFASYVLPYLEPDGYRCHQIPESLAQP